MSNFTCLGKEMRTGGKGGVQRGWAVRVRSPTSSQLWSPWRPPRAGVTASRCVASMDSEGVGVGVLWGAQDQTPERAPRSSRSEGPLRGGGVGR